MVCRFFMTRPSHRGAACATPMRASHIMAVSSVYGVAVTLSIVEVDNVLVAPLHTPRPMTALVAMLIVAVEPSCVQLVPLVP